jgi:hypothetical protein
MGSFLPQKKNNINDFAINCIVEEEPDCNYLEDMEEYKEDIYVGLGIKRMKAYKCNLKIDELNKLREYFWRIKTKYTTKNWPTWYTIKRAVLFDELRASLLLKEYNIKIVNGCINYLEDSKGNFYKIPNYCINDPYFRKDVKDEQNVKEENINVSIYGPKKFEIVLSNKLKGKDLKNEIKIREQINDDKEIRLFTRGSEILNDDFLYKFNLNVYPLLYYFSNKS